jgi:hypothetical protein
MSLNWSSSRSRSATIGENEYGLILVRNERFSDTSIRYADVEKNATCASPETAVRKSGRRQDRFATEDVMSITFDGQLSKEDGKVLFENVHGTGVAVPGPPPQRWNGLLQVPNLQNEILVGDELHLILADGKSLELMVTELLPNGLRVRGSGLLPH